MFNKPKGLCQFLRETKDFVVSLTLLYEISACADPLRFKEDIARTVTKHSAMDKVWDHLGFVLQWAKYGLK